MPYLEYLLLEAGREWNEDLDTHLATISEDGTTELSYELEQLILGPLDGEYGNEILREWSPKIRVKDWLASLEANDDISPDRKMILNEWAHGLMNLAFREVA
jgi:hypothetical protein